MKDRFRTFGAYTVVFMMLAAMLALSGGPALAVDKVTRWDDTGKVGGQPIHVLHGDGAGTMYAGCDAGQVAAKTGAGPWASLGQPAEYGTWAITALATDNTGTVYAGGNTFIRSKSGTGGWQNTGFSGGEWIKDLVWDGADTLYACGGPKGVYSKTGDGDWENIGFINSFYPNALAWDGSTLYAGCGNGHVYYRAGGVWYDTGILSSGAVHALAWDGAGTIYASCGSNVYSRSDVAWTDLGRPSGYDVFDLVYDGSGTLYAAAGSRIYFSIGTGDWTDLGQPGGSWDMNALFWEGDTVYAGSRNGHCYSKTGNGAWIDTGAAGSGAIQDITCGAGDTVYAAGAYGYVYSKTGDGAWVSAGNTGGDRITSLAWDGVDTLYAGCENGHVYSKTGGGAWVDTGAVSSYERIQCIAWNGTDTLYAGTDMGGVYSRTGSGTWADFGAPSTGMIVSMACCGADSLYIGCDDGHIYSKTGTGAWVDTGNPGGEYWPISLAWDGADTVYAGLFGEVYSKTGDGGWTATGVPEYTFYIYDLAWDGVDTLYACGYGKVIYRTGNGNWVTTPDPGCWEDGYVTSLAWNGTDRLYASNASGVLVAEIGAGPGPEPASSWYLAEGTTAWGFSTYMTIVNPNDAEVSAKVTLMPTGAPNWSGMVTLAPNSQKALMNDWIVLHIGEVDFSTRVDVFDDATPIAVDRTMEWTGPGATAPEGHSSIGVTAPATTWYLPEGSTNWGFETWLLIQNPGDSEASCQVTYMIEGKGPQTKTHKVPANSRESFSMAEEIGSEDASIKVLSDIPVIAERAMYRNNRREGHGSIGAIAPANDFFLAEGAVGYDSAYITYILVQNPQETANEVDITFLTGTGEVAGPSLNMGPNSRWTVRVNDHLPLHYDVSTSVHGDQPIIAERAMYWNSPAGEACHNSVGMSEAHTSFFLPDGQSSNGRETWTLVQNPNDTDVIVQITYLTPTGTGNQTRTETVGALSRSSFSMAEHSGINGRAAILVRCVTPGAKIMCERAMYWANRAAGTDTIGGFTDN